MKIKRALRIAIGVPVVLAVGAVFVFDVWTAYRKDPAAIDELIHSLLKGKT